MNDKNAIKYIDETIKDLDKDRITQGKTIRRIKTILASIEVEN